MNHNKNFIKSDFSSRDCSTNLAKYYLLVVNILQFFAAIALCGLAIYFLISHPSGLDQFIIVAASSSWLISGITGILLSVLALAATYKENIKWLKIYLGILIVTVFLNSASTLWRQAQIKSHHSTPTVSPWKNQFDLYGRDETATETVDIVQKTLSCCGFDGPETIVFVNGSYPHSCCAEPVEVCMKPFTDKCSSVIDKWTSRTTTVYMATFYATIAAKILAAIATAYFISFLEKIHDQKVSAQYRNF